MMEKIREVLTSDVQACIDMQLDALVEKLNEKIDPECAEGPTIKAARLGGKAEDASWHKNVADDADFRAVAAAFKTVKTSKSCYVSAKDGLVQTCAELTLLADQLGAKLNEEKVEQVQGVIKDLKIMTFTYGIMDHLSEDKAKARKQAGVRREFVALGPKKENLEGDMPTCVMRLGRLAESLVDYGFVKPTGKRQNDEEGGAVSKKAK